MQSCGVCVCAHDSDMPRTPVCAGMWRYKGGDGCRPLSPSGGGGMWLPWKQGRFSEDADLWAWRRSVGRALQEGALQEMGHRGRESVGSASRRLPRTTSSFVCQLPPGISCGLLLGRLFPSTSGQLCMWPELCSGQETQTVAGGSGPACVLAERGPAVVSAMPVFPCLHPAPMTP